MKYICNNIDETEKLAKKFSKSLKNGDCIMLNGEIGAGKTTFTRLLLKNFGVKNKVVSPTFTIMNEYEGLKFRFYHFDLYRIEDSSEILELGFEDYLKYNKNSNVKKGICLIEWGENIKNMLPKKHYVINITKLGENETEIEILKTK